MRFIVNIAAVAALVAGMSVASVPSASAAPVKSGSKTGAACSVTTGSNKGKSGTYSSADGQTYCGGDWGATQCTNEGGGNNGKCKDGKALVVNPGLTQIAPIATMKNFSIAR